MKGTIFYRPEDVAHTQTASARVSVRLRPVEKRALVRTARLLKWSRNRTMMLAICHLSETMAHGQPVYVTLPPHEAGLSKRAQAAP